MRSKSPEKRGRQKVVQPPTYRIENEYNPEAMPQYFQISVNILEGRKLAFVNRHTANSYAIVVLGQKKHRTSIRRNMQEPYYRESFVFELYTSIRNLQQSSLWLAVMEPRCCAPPRLLGEASIDLGAIWTQPHHQVFHKWAQLGLPRDPTAGPVGFLQVDVSIIFRGETRVMPAIIKDEKLEDNLLLPSGSEQQCGNYLITIYGAFGLPNSSQAPGDKRFGKPPSTFVRVSFCGLVAKTATQPRNNNPVYCEKMSMVEMFPNMSQFIRFEVCSAEGCFNRVLACAHLKLGQISHDGENGFLPTFGPSLLHMYGTSFTGTVGLTGEDGPYHRGALLVALNTVVPFYQQALRSITVEPVAPLKLEQLWVVEDFCIFCPIFEVSVLDRKTAGKMCGVAVTMGEIPCGNKGEEEFYDAMNEIRARKKHYTGCLEVFKNQPVYGYLDFSNAFPVLQFATRLPDFRFRMYRNNMVHGIVRDLNLAISEVKRRLKNFDYSNPNELIEELNKALDDASGNIIKFLDIVQCSTPSICGDEDIVLRQYTTELDLKQLTLQKEEIEKIHQKITRKFVNSSTLSLVPSCGKGIGDSSTVTKKTVKHYLLETQNLAQNLMNLIYKTFEGWPDIIVWLLNGGSRMAYTKISAADVIHSVIPEQSGKDCGRIQSVYMKPLKCPKHVNTLVTGCHCIAGKVELLIWMGLYRQRSAFESYLPTGYRLKLKEYDMCIKTTTMMVECRAFIYKGKISGDFNVLESLQTFVRVSALSSVKETKVKCKTLSPVWNQVLKINRMVFMTPERLAISPPIVLVEVNNTDLSGKAELIGRFQIQPTVEDKQDYESAPKLQWYDLYKGVECTGQVLMSVQLLQVLTECTTECTKLPLFLTDFRKRSGFSKRCQATTSYINPSPNSSTLMLQVTALLSPGDQYTMLKSGEYNKDLAKLTHQAKIPERTLKTTMYGSAEECYAASPSVSKEVDVLDDFENLPANLLPTSTSYKVDIYWWGLRDLNVTKKPGVILEIEEVVIKSEVIANKQSNCNFPNGRSSHVFEAPLNDSYSPLLNIKLFDSSTFGRTLYLGTKIVKNPSKYLVNWIPKTERDASIQRASIMSSDFVQVNRMLFIKKSSNLPKESFGYGSNESMINLPNKSKQKHMKWHTLFWHREPDEEECTLLPIFTTEQQKVVTRTPNDEKNNWWVKYMRSDKGYNDEDNIHLGEKLIIYESELENQPEFSKFRDWCSSLKLYNGKKTDIREKDEQLYCGFLKAGIALYRWPPPANTVAVTDSGVDLNKGFFDDHPSNDPAKFLIRAYLIKAFNLKTKDYIGKSDAYVILNCGKKHLGDRYNYVANTLNPIFGRMYEFRCNLPEEYLLTVSLYNYEESQPDELIGSTSIDLEDRIYTKHRARVGLSKEFSLVEKYKWRDSVKPSAILEDLCLINHFPSPVISENSTTVMVNGVEYKDTERESAIFSAPERKENLCLSILHNWHTLPICGYHLVPEHVETRTLYNPDLPGIDHGKVLMWMDIFPLDTGINIPPPIDISPRKVEDYELRVTVYSVRAFVPQADYPSRKISDLYVRAWLGSTDEAQRTDVHYQCVTGESNFNWRMIFKFQYLPIVRKLVRKEKGIFTEYEEGIPPILIVQLLDNDATYLDENIGSLMLNLNAIPRGVKNIDECTLDVLENPKKINLFSTRSLHAWWPLSTINQDSGTSLLAGAIDLEITLLLQENATLMPVGIGREPPFPLPEPLRPEPSSHRFCYNLKNLYDEPPQIACVICFSVFILLTILLGLYFHLPAIVQYWLM